MSFSDVSLTAIACGCVQRLSHPSGSSSSSRRSSSRRSRRRSASAAPRAFLLTARGCCACFQSCTSIPRAVAFPASKGKWEARVAACLGTEYALLAVSPPRPPPECPPDTCLRAGFCWPRGGGV